MFLNTERTNTLRVSQFFVKKRIYIFQNYTSQITDQMNKTKNESVFAIQLLRGLQLVLTRYRHHVSPIWRTKNSYDHNVRMYAEAWSRELWPPPIVVARPFNSPLGERSIRGKRSSTRANGARRRSNTLAYVRERARIHVAGSFIKAKLPQVRAAPLTWSSWQRAFSFINESAYHARRLWSSRYPWITAAKQWHGWKAFCQQEDWTIIREAREYASVPCVT